MIDYILLVVKLKKKKKHVQCVLTNPASESSTEEPSWLDYSLFLVSPADLSTVLIWTEGKNISIILLHITGSPLFPQNRGCSAPFVCRGSLLVFCFRYLCSTRSTCCPRMDRLIGIVLKLNSLSLVLFLFRSRSLLPLCISKGWFYISQCKS